MTRAEDQETRHIDAKQLYSRYAASLVPVISVDADGDEGIGSAFHVGDGAFVTARHVVEGKRSCHVELDTRRLLALALSDVRPTTSFENDRIFPIDTKVHPDADNDVAVFSVPDLSGLPAVTLGGHLDDWINDEAFILNEILVLGFPPIPLSKRNVLVAMRAQINAVVDLVTARHVHFIASATARGGLSGGVALSEWGVALGVVTSSLLKNGQPEELGYLTILSVEPILECLAHHRLMPRECVELWDGLFTAQTEYFGVPEKKWAHSWIEDDRDGHRARISFATPDDIACAQIKNLLASRGDFTEISQPPKVVNHCWLFNGDYRDSEKPLAQVRESLRNILLARGYQTVVTPGVTAHTLESPPSLADILDAGSTLRRPPDAAEADC